MTERDDVRYGVFLLPDARTSAAVTAITSCLRAQFGTVSAGRFPPHVTLAGSLPLADAETELLTTIRAVALEHEAVTLHNAGPRSLWRQVLAFDVHLDVTGVPNAALVNLAMAVVDAVRPLVHPAVGRAADLRDRDTWHAHLSLASHDLAGRPELLHDVEVFVRDLHEPYPSEFEATRLGIFRLHHADWAGPWWTTFTWEFVTSIKLGADRSKK